MLIICFYRKGTTLAGRERREIEGEFKRADILPADASNSALRNGRTGGGGGPLSRLGRGACQGLEMTHGQCRGPAADLGILERPRKVSR